MERIFLVKSNKYDGVKFYLDRFNRDGAECKVSITWALSKQLTVDYEITVKNHVWAATFFLILISKFGV